jgi:shikimate dehydrogenase
VKRFGVFGWPVAHSRSPQIHRAAYRELGLDDHHYQRLPVPPDLFEETARALPAAGFDGANVTIPHKEAALALADTVDETARAIGAVNTLTFEGGAIEGTNTDAPGFLAAIGTPPATALVLGAGGSARAVVWALLQAGSEVSVLARTPARAEGLGAAIVTDAVSAEMVVNCTPVGLHDDAVPLDPDGFATVVDLAYRPGGTAFVNRARAAGATTVDGLEILVRQGALSFERWTGLDAPLGAMRLAAQAKD